MVAALKNFFQNASDFLWANMVTLLLIVGNVITFGGLYLYISKLIVPGEINVWEIRLYVWLFLLLCLVVVLGILRLYNAVRFNSGMLLRLKTALDKYVVALRADRNKVSAASNALRASISRMTTILTASIRDLKSKGKE